ncbi:MAG: sensor histidine kinase [Pseudonocardiales bacterium]|nr:sensor histidine kinase [Pseudonocardiales bacterium]
MSAAADPGCRRARFAHVAVLYGSDAQLRNLLLPYLAGALGRREEVLVVISVTAERVLRDALGDAADSVQWGGPGLSYERLGRMFGAFSDYLEQRHRAGVPAHVIAEPDPDISYDRLSQYLRHLSMANEVYAAYGCPMLFLWDERRYPHEVMAHVRAVHPLLFDSGGLVINAEYCAPPDYLAANVPSVPAVPIDLDLDVLLYSPDGLALLRRRLRSWGTDAALGDRDTDDIVIAVDEIATNALEHGQPPARVRGWSTADAVFIRVDDHGRVGIPQTTGYVRPRTDARRGRGVWMARHLADVLTTHHSPTGTTVTMRFPR